MRSFPISGFRADKVISTVRAQEIQARKSQHGQDQHSVGVDAHAEDRALRSRNKTRQVDCCEHDTEQHAKERERPDLTEDWSSPVERIGKEDEAGRAEVGSEGVRECHLELPQPGRRYRGAEFGERRRDPAEHEPHKAVAEAGLLGNDLGAEGQQRGGRYDGNCRECRVDHDRAETAFLLPFRGGLGVLCLRLLARALSDGYGLCLPGRRGSMRFTATMVMT